jgi:polysaccharide pyruvyl transferase WcaK-like protein
MVSFVQAILSTRDIDIVLLPHTARPGLPESRMNDLPLCSEIHALINHNRVHLIDTNLRPTELRALIAAGAALVTSRFHAMISALATATPVFVIGWSHKYDEVLTEFSMEEMAVPYDQFDVEGLAHRFGELWERREGIAARIERHLPAVLDRARNNLEVIRREIESQKS